MDISRELRAVFLDPQDFAGSEGIVARSPIDGTVTAHVKTHDAGATTAAIDRAHAAFLKWRSVPAPRRGELVRLFGEELRANKDALAALVTIEAGKIVPEARGEVQEMIDICDFACGLSRQLYGLSIASERPGHRMSRDVAPARRRRRDQRVQLPGRGLGVELRARRSSAATPWCGSRPRRRRSRRSRVRRSSCARARASRSRARPRPRVSPRSSSATRRSASSSSTIAASRSSARPARRAWAAPSHRASPRASVARCSSSAATTR